MVPVLILGALVLAAIVAGRKGRAVSAPATVAAVARQMADGTASVEQIAEAARTAKAAGLAETAAVMEQTVEAAREVAASKQLPASVKSTIEAATAKTATATDLRTAAQQARTTGHPSTAALMEDRAADLERAPAPATIRRGSKGGPVKQAQRLLAAAEFSPGAIDGDFGRRTDQATRAFQTARKLKVDGVIGPATWAALQSARPIAVAAPTPALAQPAASLAPAAPAARQTLRRGSKGESVHEAQRLLAAAGFSPGAIDGDFGRGTDAAVRAFQRAHGLAVDGVIGPATWSALAPEASVTAAGASGSRSLRIPQDAWQRFAFAMVAAESPKAVAPNGALGLFRYDLRRLRDLGVIATVTQEGGVRRGEFRTAEIAAAWPTANFQHQLFARDMKARARQVLDKHASEIRQIHAGQPATLSGLLAVAHSAGSEGLRSWLRNSEDKQAFPHTTAAYLRANGIF